MTDHCLCTGWTPFGSGHIGSEVLSVMQTLHQKENVLKVDECRGLGNTFCEGPFEWLAVLPLIVACKPRSKDSIRRTRSVLQEDGGWYRDSLLNNLLVLEELSDAKVLTVKMIKEMENMKGSLNERIVRTLSSEDSDGLTKSAEILEKHGYPDEKRVLLVMTELKAFNCLSVEETTSLLRHYCSSINENKDDDNWACDLVVLAATKDSGIVKNMAVVMDTHGFSDIPKVLKTMAELKALDCLSVEEAVAVFRRYTSFCVFGESWKTKLVRVAATKDGNIVKNMAAIMDKHFFSNVMKVMAELKALKSLSVDEIASVFQHFSDSPDKLQWEVKLLRVFATKKRDIVESIATIMDGHDFSEVSKILKACSGFIQRQLISEGDLLQQDSLNSTVASIFFLQCGKSQGIVSESVDVLKTCGMVTEAEILSAASEAFQVVRESEHWKKDSLTPAVLALYWILLHFENDRVERFGESERLNKATLTHKLQAVGSLIVRRNSDPNYQHLEDADLSLLKQTSLCDWCLELPELITSLLDPYSIGGPEIEDRLTVLILCYWCGLISDEECERVYSLDDSEWRPRLGALQNEDINDVLRGGWEEYWKRQVDKHERRSVIKEEFQSKHVNAISSVDDFTPYMGSILPHLSLLGTVLGIPQHTATTTTTAVVSDRPGDPASQCREVLQRWLGGTPHPTWDLFCSKVENTEEFNTLRAEVCTSKRSTL